MVHPSHDYLHELISQIARDGMTEEERLAAVGQLRDEMDLYCLLNVRTPANREALGLLQEKATGLKECLDGLNALTWLHVSSSISPVDRERPYDEEFLERVATECDMVAATTHSILREPPDTGRPRETARRNLILRLASLYEDVTGQTDIQRDKALKYSRFRPFLDFVTDVLKPIDPHATPDLERVVRALLKEYRKKGR